MTNSMRGRKKLITPERAASLIPVFISSGISILLIIFFVMPKYFKSTQVYFELNGLITKKNKLDNLKSQYKIINKKFDKLNQEKSKIIELITGTSNLDTLLAKLGEIGRKNNVEFISIVPQKVMFAVDKPDEKNISDKQVVSMIDPLLVEGTKKYIIEFTFKTDFINLVSFLREIEFQENVILLNDINLRLISQDDNNAEFDNTFEKIEVKINTIFYGKS